MNVGEPQHGPGHPRTTLIARVEDWARAIVANDADRIATFMTDDWVIVSEAGITSRKEFLAVIRSGNLTHSAMEIVSEPRVQAYAEQRS